MIKLDSQDCLVVSCLLAACIVGGWLLYGGETKKTDDKREMQSPIWQPMTNDQIIQETKKCEEAGLEAHGLVVPEHGARLVMIQCHPKTSN